jgi:hypothetical protein
MAERRKGPPAWFYAVLSVGSLVASGIFLGKMNVVGATVAVTVRAVLFGVLGVFWLLVCRNCWTASDAAAGER